MKPIHNTIYWLKSPTGKRLLVGLGALIVFSLLACWRYPTYLRSPNFYAEDGTVFATNMVHMGFFRSLMTPFNGYFIWGIYLLEEVGFILNHVFFGGNFLALPQSLAIASYGFWGLLAALPLLLFWNDIKKIWLILIGLGLAMMPMPSFNYAVLGTIGNDKFVFLFIAFLLIIKRWRLPAKSPWIYPIDAALVVCAFTNASTYLLFPFALVPYWSGYRQFKQVEFYKKLLKNRSFISLVVMGILAASQLAYVALKGGVSTLQNYMQQPFQYDKSIEIFIHRTLLFPFDFWGAKHLNDVTTVCLLIILGTILWRYSRSKDRIVIVFGFWTALTATALFVSQRPGVSQFYSHYQSSGTDNFFYTQNMVMLFSVMYVLTRYIESTKRLSRATFLIGMFLIWIPLSMFIGNDIGRNATMNRATGTLEYATQQACVSSHGSTITVPVYPESAQFLKLNRTTYCTAQVLTYIPAHQPLPLTPADNDYVLVSKNTVDQVFTATYLDLNGISVYFSTFGGTTGTYKLSLYNKSCTVRLRSTTFNASDAQDNSYFDIHFPYIANSKGQEYCYTVSAVHLIPDKPSLAIQLSSPTLYPAGRATENGKALSDDVVFDLLYK
jgi:hypothetical protein